MASGSENSGVSERSNLKGVTRLYLDSNAVSEGDGFRLSATTEEMIELAQAANVEVVVPEPVLVELEHQFERELISVRDQVVANSKRVTRIRREQYDVPAIDLTAAIGHHREAIESFLKGSGIIIAPFTARSSAELFGMAAARQRPFRETSKTVTDAGFKDAVIYLSILDHLRMYPRPAAFVSRDSDYAGAERLLPDGVTLAQITAVEATEELRRRLHLKALDDADARRRIADQELHGNAVESDRVKAFVIREFRLPDLLQSGQVREITAVDVVRLEVRALVPLMQDVAPGEEVRLTVYGLLQVQQVVETWTPPTVALRQRPGLDIGFGDKPSESVQPSAAPPRRDFGGRNQQVLVAIEVTAVRTATGYKNFQPLKLHVPTGLISSTKHFKYEGDAWIQELRKRGDIE